MTQSKDAFNGSRLRDPEAQGMSEGRVDMLSGVAFSQQQDAPRLVTPPARRGRRQELDEVRAMRAEALKGGHELVGVAGGRT